ncbi:MAG: hypothetical protein AAGI03_00680 [Pseudomonadota bacterium]
MPEAAVKKNAHVWERDEHNHYVEPVWCSRRLFEVEPFDGLVVDPCAGFGHVVQGAVEAGVLVHGYDLVDRGRYGVIGGRNFFSDSHTHGRWPVDNIASNPPYGKRPKAEVRPGERGRFEEEFVRVALQRARYKVAVFLQGQWISGAARGLWLEGLPLYRVYHVSPRPSCPPGHVIAAGQKPGNGTADYAWFVFLKGFDGAPTVHWLRRDG